MAVPARADGPDVPDALRRFVRNRHHAAMGFARGVLKGLLEARAALPVFCGLGLCHAPSDEIVPQHLFRKQRGMAGLAAGGRVAVHRNQLVVSSDIGAHRENSRPFRKTGRGQRSSGHPVDARDVEGRSASAAFLCLLFEREYGLAVSAFPLGGLCVVWSWAGISVRAKAAGPGCLNLAGGIDRTSGYGRGILLEQASVHHLCERRLLENQPEPIFDEDGLRMRDSSGAYLSDPKNCFAAAGCAIGRAGIVDHLHHSHLHSLRFHLESWHAPTDRPHAHLPAHARMDRVPAGLHDTDGMGVELVQAQRTGKAALAAIGGGGAYGVFADVARPPLEKSWPEIALPCGGTPRGTVSEPYSISSMFLPPLGYFATCPHQLSMN